MAQRERSIVKKYRRESLFLYGHLSALPHRVLGLTPDRWSRGFSQTCALPECGPAKALTLELEFQA